MGSSDVSSLFDWVAGIGTPLRESHSWGEVLGSAANKRPAAAAPAQAPAPPKKPKGKGPSEADVVIEIGDSD